ncbi:MAG: hypothetical protein ABI609_16620 [Acidobacteriota bacterium]
MGWIQDQAEKAHEKYRALVLPLLGPGERLLGVCQATQSKMFSNKIFVIGVTPQRFVMQQVDRKNQACAEPISVAPGDIVRASVDGWGGGLTHFLTADWGEIRFDLASGGYTLAILGGGADQMLTGESQREGKMRFLEFLASARGIT